MKRKHEHQTADNLWSKMKYDWLCLDLFWKVRVKGGGGNKPRGSMIGGCGPYVSPLAVYNMAGKYGNQEGQERNRDG